MAKTLKVGLIGLGGIAEQHVVGWKSSQHAELVAGCDLNPAAFERWRLVHGVTRLTTDPADLFNDPDLDIIDICAPNAYHASLTIGALDAGKHVICEKPLAPTTDEIRSMIAARDRAGKLLMTAQHFRFTPESRALKAELERGTLGRIYHARGWMLRRAAAATRPTFIMRQHAGGGAVIDIGVHILDLSLWLMGNPQPVAVSAVTRTELAHQPGAFSIWGGAIPPEFDVEEFAAAFSRFESGAVLILEVSWLLHHDTPPPEDMQVWLYGTQAGCHWPTCQVYESDFAEQRLSIRAVPRASDVFRPHARECIEFARAVAEGGPSPVPAEQSLQVMTILNAIYRSQELGREVWLNEAL
ncbi:MAG TPA: Gfo/Idh/MocA family oxidoreductase [Ardenticatenaceae bacterium]|nr:Gfo/Idh/MocA family oxidoreductase [Ardenticatenaceae bacterium]